MLLIYDFYSLYRFVLTLLVPIHIHNPILVNKPQPFVCPDYWGYSHIYEMFSILVNVLNFLIQSGINVKVVDFVWSNSNRSCYISFHNLHINLGTCTI